ncbi:MAG: hypothetical protein OES24_14710 [Acidimicrobiia bacterium]|nr:hypothetical protein [Acidimicrobiia bacterium]
MSALEPVVDADAGMAGRFAGHPVRRSTAVVVVSVGTDHHRFDRLIGWIDEWRDLHPDVVTVVQSGTSAPSRHGSRDLIPHAELLELFRGATAVVSHGGPSTVMDARMSGRLPIVVARNPAYHEHIDEHQMRFADHLDRHGVAVVVDDRDALFAALDRALADPDSFTVTADHGNTAGVLSFARAVDRLIGTCTPIGPIAPAAPVVAAPAADVSGRSDPADERPVISAGDRRKRPATNPLVERRKSTS